MNPLERLLDIESRLNADAISVDEACAEIFTGPKPWSTPWWKERHPLPELNQPIQLLANLPVCPQCGSHRVRRRKRTNDWVCQVGQGGKPEERHADFAFPEPRLELRPDKMAIRRHKQGVRLKYEELGRASWEAWLQSPEGIDNRLRALRLCIADSKRYLSLSDTKTLCRPCAAREDSIHLRRSERKAAARKETSSFAELDAFE